MDQVEIWSVPTGPSDSLSVSRTEDYAYDYAARLSAWDNTTDGENLSYDERGNITSRAPRHGQGATVTLTYTGDRLATRKEGTGAAVPFAHDAFARVTTDAESGLSIAYNALDLPESISQGTTLKARYSYLSDGTKVSAQDATGAGLVYRGPFTYRRNAAGTLTFESAAFEGGRLTEAGPRYFVTDHLGSVRAVIDGIAASTTTYPPAGFFSIDDYAPYGTKSTSSASSYLSLAASGSTVSLRDSFTGQEDQGPDFGLPYIDYGARQYSPALSRWLVPDPMGEKYYDVSPYMYCAGNPVNIVDPAGLDWYLFNEDGDYMYRIEADGEHRIVLANNHKDKQGNTVLTYDFFDFADPIHDPEDIDNGIINTIIRVSSEEVFSMLSSQGAFSKGPHSLAFESTRGDAFDYSFSLLKNVYAKNVLKIKEGNIQSNALFLPDGEKTAHNLMNFGNFLWGATGYTLEYPENVLLFGADVNSRLGGKRNGYGYQPDSPDDQLSITLGIRFAKKNQYRNPSFKHHGR